MQKFNRTNEAEINYQKALEIKPNYLDAQKNIDILSKKSKKEIFEMYVDMKENLQHNSDLIQNYNGSNILRQRIINE